jgi:two-component system, NarL family, sensor kinase
MQNVSKHAPNAHAVTITLQKEDFLRFEVRDDGAGFDASASSLGAGLANMRDRLDAVGGELAVRSSGAGTVVTGSVPLRPVKGASAPAA